VEHAGTPVKTTDAGTVTEWEHFDYGYHSGIETDCNFPLLISIVRRYSSLKIMVAISLPF
jgi:hypothetical protein